MMRLGNGNRWNWRALSASALAFLILNTNASCTALNASERHDAMVVPVIDIVGPTSVSTQKILVIKVKALGLCQGLNGEDSSTFENPIEVDNTNPYSISIGAYVANIDSNSFASDPKCMTFGPPFEFSKYFVFRNTGSVRLYFDNADLKYNVFKAFPGSDKIPDKLELDVQVTDDGVKQ